MKTLLSFLFLCVFMSTSLMAQDTAKNNMTADVKLEKKEELYKKSPKNSSMSIKNNARTQLMRKSKNDLNKPSVISRHHRTLIDNHKRVASYY